MTQRYKMVLAYDGSLYAGWQTQPGHVTIQGELERVLKELTGETARIHSSGRTDRGVHAQGQVAHFDLEKPVVLRRFVLGFNALLKEDIRVYSIEEVSSEFHARYSAKGKEYRYFIWNGPVLPPSMRFYRTWVRPRLDVKAMQEAARLLVGNNDFAAFSANPNREIDGTVRHLRELVVRRHGREITIVARGDGFLYKMVRSLAGFLIRVGNGELKPEAASTILSSKVRTARVPTAAPQGLFLWRVEY
jgi:tRNA pseudouridine38-40 synthase